MKQQKAILGQTCAQNMLSVHAILKFLLHRATQNMIQYSLLTVINLQNGNVQEISIH